jgi:hypothetical protein
MAYDATPIDTDCDDLQTMIADIRQHRTDGDIITNADDPGTDYDPVRVPRIGFVGQPSGKTWTITIWKLRDQLQVDGLAGWVFRTREGRQRLLDYVLTP